MFKPSIIAMDFETTGLNYWSPDFKILSCALAWRAEDKSLRTRYLEGEDVLPALDKIASDGIPVVVHNIGFEYGVTAFHAPSIKDLITVDTMRLAQVFDNGGNEFDPDRGYGLAKCVKRILRRDNHKTKFYDWLRENAGIKKGQEGANLDALPKSLFIEYNLADAELTLYLFEYITKHFDSIGYSWTLDHSLYQNVSRRISAACAAGVKVNRVKLTENLKTITDEIRDIDLNFRTQFKAEVEAVESLFKDTFVNALKTEVGRNRRLNQPEKWAFNFKSIKHLQALFIAHMNCKPKFFTPKGKPSFTSKHLPSYGTAGKMLATRNSRLLVKQQIESLLELSELDGRWHLSLKTTGTATGRFSGGNVNG